MLDERIQRFLQSRFRLFGKGYEDPGVPCRKPTKTSTVGLPYADFLPLTKGHCYHNLLSVNIYTFQALGCLVQLLVRQIPEKR